MAFAGLWETWIGPNGEEMETAAIVTTEANAEMATVHHRAPVIVPPEQFDLWLSGEAGAEAAAALIKPAADGSMEVYEVSPAVNKVTNEFHRTGGALHSAAGGEQPARPRTRSKRAANDSGQGSLF